MTMGSSRLVDPFLEERHLHLQAAVRELGEKHLRTGAERIADTLAGTRSLVARLAEGGLFRCAVPPPFGTRDLRSLAVVREGLAYFSSLADGLFAAHALGSFPVAAAGTDVQRRRWLTAAASGEKLGAFAATEPEAGSDLGAVRTRAEPEGGLWRLTGVKAWVSNAGLAGFYAVLARTSGEAGSRGLSMLLVDAEAPGIAVRPLETAGGRLIGEVRFEATPAVLLGQEGQGRVLAHDAFDALRPACGAAGCGLAERALDETLRRATSRRQFGRLLAEMQATRLALGEMEASLHAARLAVRHAAWLGDRGPGPARRASAAAKLLATEAAGAVVDRAVQLHGAEGVVRGSTVERLEREARALRLELGTSEIQKLIVAREALAESR